MNRNCPNCGADERNWVHPLVPRAPAPSKKAGFRRIETDADAVAVAARCRVCGIVHRM